MDYEDGAASYERRCPVKGRLGIRLSDFVLQSSASAARVSLRTLWSTLILHVWGGGGYTREIGTMWQIGVLAAERRVFWAKKWPISAVSHYVLSEKFSGRLCANDRFCGRVIATLKIPEYTGIFSIRRTAAVLTPQTLKSHKNGPKFAPFPHKNANLPHCTSWEFIGFLDTIQTKVWPEEVLKGIGSS